GVAARILARIGPQRPAQPWSGPGVRDWRCPQARRPGARNLEGEGAGRYAAFAPPERPCLATLGDREGAAGPAGFATRGWTSPGLQWRCAWPPRRWPTPGADRA